VEGNFRVPGEEKKGFRFECGDYNCGYIIVFYLLYSALFKESDNEFQVNGCKINPQCNVV